MIIPCIDLQGGKAVQLVRGRKLALSVDDVLGLLDRFRDYPILHVIDLDAALGTGSNGRWIKILSRRAKMKIRVGGGIRSVARAEKILSWGAEKIIVGSAAFRDGQIAHDFLRELRARVGRKNVILALDTERGQIVVRGWRQRLKLRPEDVIPELEPYCSGISLHLCGQRRNDEGYRSRVVSETAACDREADHRRRRHSQPQRSSRAGKTGHARSRRHGALSGKLSGS